MSYKRGKWVHRIAILIISIGFVVLCTFAIGRLLHYFNTGTEPGDALNLSPNIILEHTPKIEWLEPDPRIQENLGQNKFLIKEIEENYINSWYLLNLSIKNGKPISLEDNFSEIPRSSIALASSSFENEPSFEVRRADLSHTLRLNWMAPDLQICAFEDYGVNLIKRVVDKKSNDIISEQELIMDFQVVMTLEDGRWRIRHIVADTIQPLNTDTLARTGREGYLTEIENVQGVNYYPRETPWHDFWSSYNDTIISTDFRLIDSLGFNTVRVFIPYEHFGKGNVKISEVEKLQNLLDIAEESGLQVIVTLFDFLYYFDVMSYPAIDRQLEIIADSIKNKPALLAWDIKNEPDLDFEHYGKDRVKRWLDFVITRLREYDQNTPITIGWLDPLAAPEYHEVVDFVSFHYYEKPENFLSNLHELRDSIDGEKSILIEELGLSTFNLLIAGNSENDQARYYEEMLDAISSDIHTSFALWTLYDFEDIPNQVVGPLPWKKIPQKAYGLIKIDSTAKLSIDVIQKYLK